HMHTHGAHSLLRCRPRRDHATTPFPYTTLFRSMNDEVIVQRVHRNDYDHAVRAAGARFVEIGFAHGTYPYELEAAFTERTAAVLDWKSTRLNSSHSQISYAVFCLKKKITPTQRG